MKRSLRMIAFTAAACMPALALAHPGHGEHSGFAAGLVHPFGGTVHLLALIAVGIVASRLSGRTMVMLLAAFMCLLGAGAAVGSAGTAFLTGVATASALVLTLAAAVTRMCWPAPTAGATR